MDCRDLIFLAITILVCFGILFFDEVNKLETRKTYFQARDKDGQYSNNKWEVNHYKETCLNLSKTHNLADHQWMTYTPHEMFVVDQKKFYFCRMWKVGTQFWRSLVKFLSPVKHWIKGSKTDPYKRTVGHIRHSYRSAMFVRDPWSRLWSAYNDKFANFHPYFTVRYSGELFKVLGIKGNFRNSRSKQICLHNITFSNFINLILHQYKHKIKFDVHWMPYWTLCNYCDHKFEFVGKLENMKQDLPEMINKFDLGDPEAIQAEIIQGNYSSLWLPAFHDLFSHLNTPIEKRRYPKKCKTLKTVLKSKWRSLINQGYFRHDDPEPAWFNEIKEEILTDMSPKTRNHVIQHIKQEINAQGFKYTTSQQKEMKVAMFREAMSSLTQSQICAIEYIYRPDFLLFDYKLRCN